MQIVHKSRVQLYKKKKNTSAFKSSHIRYCGKAENGASVWVFHAPLILSSSPWDILSSLLGNYGGIPAASHGGKILLTDIPCFLLANLTLKELSDFFCF